MTTLSHALKAILEHRLAQVRVALPARVEAYYLEEQTADVQPLIQDRLVTEDGERYAEDLPVIPRVPVAWQQAGGAFVTLPLGKGDTGLVVFCDRELDQWVAKGGVVEPLDERTHALNGAVFYPGLHDGKSNLGGAHASNVVVGFEGGRQIHIEPGSGNIHLGSDSAADFVALAAKVKTELDKVASAFNAHTHTYAPGNLTPTVTGPAGSYTSASVAADKTKAD